MASATTPVSLDLACARRLTPPDVQKGIPQKDIRIGNLSPCKQGRFGPYRTGLGPGLEPCRTVGRPNTVTASPPGHMKLQNCTTTE
jgi:hypothetical protein